MVTQKYKKGNIPVGQKPTSNDGSCSGLQAVPVKRTLIASGSTNGREGRKHRISSTGPLETLKRMKKSLESCPQRSSVLQTYVGMQVGPSAGLELYSHPVAPRLNMA